MADYLKRLAQHYEAAGIDHMVMAGAVWRNYNRMIKPQGPANQNYTISPSQTKQLLHHFKKAVLIRYTDGFSAAFDAVDASNAPWYAVACNRFIGLDEYNFHFRNHIRRSLRLCEVRKVDAEYIATHGYDCFMATFARYRNSKQPKQSRADYARNILYTKDFPDL
jgi:hypothetical protein